MLRGRRVGLCFLLGVAAVAAGAGMAQFEDREDNLPDPIPPPLPKKPPPKDAPKYESILQDDPDAEWGLPDDLLEMLQRKAWVYETYSRRFTCDEVARLADYDDSGEVSKERVKRYAYLLLRSAENESVREFRQEMAKDGKIKPSEVQDEDPFPPAYAWVFLFSEFHTPYFAFRLVDTRFDGFDLVHEIEFKGSLRFTSGKDIRQWEGRVLIDAFEFTPIEIQAEPQGQRERLAEMFRRYTSSFSIIGFRSGKPPLGYRAKIKFDLPRRVRDPTETSTETMLRFPTTLRYDTRKAVSPTQLLSLRASTRTYESYRFTDVIVGDEVGDIIDAP